jgi:phage terminase large subunit
MNNSEIALLKEWILSPTKFVESMFGLVPQPLKEGFAIGVNTDLRSVSGKWFKPFEKGKHITWQQWVIFLAIERAIKGYGSRQISVASGHGIGKSSSMAMILLWFLVCYPNAQIPCTAPTAQQMFDVLWKEVSIWHSKLPQNFRDKISVESSYIRMLESPKSWFARAATARKEAPEALAGIHSDNVFLMADEASGVPDEVFITGEGAMTGGNAFVLLISNYTRLSGYFHETQENEGEWQRLVFSSEDSPIVDRKFVEKMRARGEDSNEFRVRVKGLPPNQDADIKGYVPLLSMNDLRLTTMNSIGKPVILGIDPSGEGRNKSAFVVRDRFRAIPMGIFKDMRSKEIAAYTIELMEKFKILPENVMVDGFGVGMETINEFSLIGIPIMGILVGNPATDSEQFDNMKAQMYWRMREWLIKGGELSGTAKQWEQVLWIRYANSGGRVKIMGKKAMLDAGFDSPDLAEALMLTFFKEHYFDKDTEEKVDEEYFDPYGGL